MTIGGIGVAGDGIVTREGADPLHIARTLPGEHVRVSLPRDRKGASGRATLLEVLRPSPARITPPCPHFTEGCGGCALQHWADDAYAAWKHGLVIEALTRAGFERPEVAALARTPPGARRRMDFAVRRVSGGVAFGLHRAHSTEIVDLSVCHVLHPVLAGLLAPLRRTLSGLAALRLDGSVLANLLDGGADLLIRTDGNLAATDRAKLAALAVGHSVPRMAWARGDGPTETACLSATPHVVFGGHRVAPPPGAFLQASQAGESAIVAAVLAGLPERLTAKSRAIELYAGSGTLSFPLADRLRVLAYEGDAGAVQAVRRAQAGTRVEVTQRDLVRQPLSAKELSGAAAIVLDPPHAGAARQMEAIAASGVGRVIYVSCNPASLGRDAVMLARAGYGLRLATPIDQFLWSAQVECVAVFER